METPRSLMKTYFSPKLQPNTSTDVILTVLELFEKTPQKNIKTLSPDVRDSSDEQKTATESTYLDFKKTTHRRSVSNPVSYASTPLNRKIRKGHQFFKYEIKHDK